MPLPQVLLLGWVLVSFAMEIQELLRADIASKFPSLGHLEAHSNSFLLTQIHHPSNYILQLSTACERDCHQRLETILGSTHYNFLHREYILITQALYSSLQTLQISHSEILRIIPYIPEMKIEPSLESMHTSCQEKTITIRIHLVPMDDLEFTSFHQRVLMYTSDDELMSSLLIDTSEFRPGPSRAISAKASCSVLPRLIKFLTAQPEITFIDEKK